MHPWVGIRLKTHFSGELNWSQYGFQEGTYVDQVVIGVRTLAQDAIDEKKSMKA